VPQPPNSSLTGSELPVPVTRIGAYAVVVVDDRVLLTENSALTNAPGTWSLPGGGIDHGESPLQTLVREVWEETGHDLVDPVLVDVGSARFTGRSPGGVLEDFHHLQIVYTAGVTDVREPVVHDLGGSTAAAAWVPLGEVATLPLGARTELWLARLLPEAP
jgi:8-oxo-dGTP diphosphatase